MDAVSDDEEQHSLEETGVSDEQQQSPRGSAICSPPRRLHMSARAWRQKYAVSDAFARIDAVGEVYANLGLPAEDEDAEEVATASSAESATKRPRKAAAAASIDVFVAAIERLAPREPAQLPSSVARMGRTLWTD